MLYSVSSSNSSHCRVDDLVYADNTELSGTIPSELALLSDLIVLLLGKLRTLILVEIGSKNSTHMLFLL